VHQQSNNADDQKNDIGQLSADQLPGATFFAAGSAAGLRHYALALQGMGKPPAVGLPHPIGL
jgi:hypothetical protein